MTPRKEIFIKIKEALMNIDELEFIDLQRGQIENDAMPDYWTAALIKIGNADIESMPEEMEEGVVETEITLYCKDGWMDQHNNTDDPEHGLIEIDLLDKITDAINYLEGDQFRCLSKTDESDADTSLKGIISITQTYVTHFYRRNGNYEFTKRKLKLN